ncbi:MAG: molybdopterin molybdotransferase MoeA [Maribacter sp.]|nr:molybdopterin molybdotransferase MoeA [Maribacter sp.]
MINFEEAYRKVMQHTLDLEAEAVGLLNSNGRTLAEDIVADRDFPPFDRSTKDGIVINYSALEKGVNRFKIEAVLSAGMPQTTLVDTANCMEIMTGAVIPENADTVIMYEQLTIKNDVATLSKKPTKGQDIHKKGSDVVTSSVLLKKGKRIGAAEIGVLASVGKSKVQVKRLPKVCVVSTGDELVDVDQVPLPHQIRKSNTLSLFAALQKEGIMAERLHLTDDRKVITVTLSNILKDYDVLLLSGGVSKGKFDFIPEVMELLGVQKVFHRVAQRPGKPFLFGKQEETNTVVFSFPGNPVSTFANYHIYFLPWLQKCLGLPQKEKEVLLEEPIRIKPPLTRFIQVMVQVKKGITWAKTIRENGSGDLTSLAYSDGFICLQPREAEYKKGEIVPFVATRN